MNVWIRFLSGGLSGETRSLRLAEGASAVVGRSDETDVPLNADVDIAASSRHAQIVASGGSLFLYDLGSTNGTWVAGQKVQQAALPSGTRVVFGRGGPEAEILWAPDAPAPLPPAVAPPPHPATGAKTAPGFAGFTTAPPSSAPAMPAAAKSSSVPITKPRAFAILQPDREPQAAPAPPLTKPQAFQAMPHEPEPQAYEHAQAPAPAAAGDTCGMCGSLLFFICYQCRRTLCGSHYDPATGVCVECAGAAVPPTVAVSPPADTYGEPNDMGLPTRRRAARPPVDDMALPPRRRSGVGGTPTDDALPPRRRAGPPGDDELPPRRRRPQ